MIGLMFHAIVGTGAAIDDTLAPVTLAEAKLHCREDGTENDVLMEGLIRAAGAMIEQHTGLVCRARSVQQSCARFDARVILYKRPVNAVTAIEYDAAANGAATALPGAGWRLREFAGNPVIVAGFDASFPATEPVDGAVRVTYNAGYLTNADIPADIRLAALQAIGNWFENRETVGPSALAELPLSARALLAPYRRGFIG